jgi:hypothetical protein
MHERRAGRHGRHGTTLAFRAAQSVSGPRRKVSRLPDMPHGSHRTVQESPIRRTAPGARHERERARAVVEVVVLVNRWDLALLVLGVLIVLAALVTLWVVALELMP